MRHRLFLQSILWLVFCPLLVQITTAQSSLRQLRDQLLATNGLREADIVAIVSEHAVNDAAQKFVGLEVKYPSSGASLKITSISVELKPAAALVKLGIQAFPSIKIKSVNLRLWGKLGNGEVESSRLRIPVEVTNVALGTDDSNGSSLMRFLLKEWTTPEKWNELLPPLEIPLQLNQVVDLPAAVFESNGEMPMTINTPPYQIKLDFNLTSLFVLDRRAVLALNLQSKNFAAPTKGSSENENEAEAALVEEIARLSQHLNIANDVRIRIRKEAVNALFTQMAAAQSVDLTVNLKPARIRTEDIDALIGKITNYTDIESGNGEADIQRLSIEEMNAGRIFLRLTGQGDLDTRVKGREFGIPYNLSPHGKFSINNELVPLQITTNNNRLLLRATPGAKVPVKVNLAIDVAGHPIGLSRIIDLRADEWLKNFELPDFFSHELQLPRQIVIKDKKLNITRSEASHYNITNLRVDAREEAIEILADLK